MSVDDKHAGDNRTEHTEHTEQDFALSCPIPISDYPTIMLAHGGGGTLMRQLIESMFAAAFANPDLETGHDSACLDLSEAMGAAGARLAFTTDSYVVSPLFFPGGDIGALAVHGTVNDLAMAGARPLYLSVGFILEEGLPMVDLWRIVQTMRDVAEQCGVRIVTGDTKVVERGKGDGIFINTAGVGVVAAGRVIAPQRIEAGDAVLISGDIGRHGTAIMAARGDLGFAGEITSDVGDLSGLVRIWQDAGIELHCLRDLTRGGLAGAVCEIADTAGRSIAMDETLIPVERGVRALCEVLGLDPLHVANEGRLVAFVAAADAERAVELARAEAGSEQARIVGRVVEAGTETGAEAGAETKTGHRSGTVTLRGAIGATRLLTPLSGEQLPRIC